MTNNKAIELLKRFQEPEAWEQQITSEAFEALGMAIDALKMPYRKPKDIAPPTVSKLEQVEDCISRQAAIDALRDAGIINYSATGDGYGMIQAINVIKGLPSAQPEIIVCGEGELNEPHYDEWCDGCKEYDTEKHSCPRFNRVIQEAVNELKAKQPKPAEMARDIASIIENEQDMRVIGSERPR